MKYITVQVIFSYFNIKILHTVPLNVMYHSKELCVCILDTCIMFLLHPCNKCASLNKQDFT